MPQSDYAHYATVTTTDTTGSATTGYVRFDGYSATNSPYVQVVKIQQEEGIHPLLYFKYVKSKFTMLQKMRIEKRLSRLEKSFDRAVESGQDVLAGRFLSECVREVRESAILAKGFKMFIEKVDLDKHKRHIRGGHISDTQLKDFTRPLPKDVMKKKKESEGLFDGYVVYHHWDEAAEEKRAKKQGLTADEKTRMRDPVLFGWIKESNRLYFVADWEDEYCDLTFSELVDAIGKEEEEILIPRDPVIPEQL